MDFMYVRNVKWIIVKNVIKKNIIKNIKIVINVLFKNEFI